MGTKDKLEFTGMTVNGAKLKGSIVQLPARIDYDALMRPDSQSLPHIHKREQQLKSFITEYLFDFDSTAAAQRIGIEERYAQNMGRKLLRHIDQEALLTYRRTTARIILEEGALGAAIKLVDAINDPDASLKEQMTAAVQVLEKSGVSAKQQVQNGTTINAQELAVNVWQQVNNDNSDKGSSRGANILDNGV